MVDLLQRIKFRPPDQAYAHHPLPEPWQRSASLTGGGEAHPHLDGPATSLPCSTTASGGHLLVRAPMSGGSRGGKVLPVFLLVSWGFLGLGFSVLGLGFLVDPRSILVSFISFNISK